MNKTWQDLVKRTREKVFGPEDARPIIDHQYSLHLPVRFQILSPGWETNCSFPHKFVTPATALINGRFLCNSHAGVYLYQFLCSVARAND